MKREINPFDYAEEIAKAVQKGVLLTTKSGDRVNSMTISWGMIGIKWSRQMFITFVRENRFTKSMLDDSMEFTINVPIGEYDKNITDYCGKMSGRDVDKIKELNLTLVEPDEISVPAIKELPLTLECKVLYKQKQDPDAVPDFIKKTTYPQDVPSTYPLSNRDYHTAYYGQIVKAYIVE